MRIRLFFLLLICGLTLVFLPLHSGAQSNESCPAVVTTALEALGNNCNELNRNEACYGFNNVSATFFEEVEAEFFSFPADRASLATLETIRTAPLDVQLNQWGVAAMSVQASLPNALPGQAVTMVLMGDTSVTNGVNPDEIKEPIEAVTVTTMLKSNIRSGPSTFNNVLGTVEAGTELAIDGVNENRDWFRTVFDDRPGWIYYELIDNPDAASELPVVSTDNITPMQAFYFTTGIGVTECSEAPDALLVQGPENVIVNLTANGAKIDLGSTILLRLIDENTMEIIVINGPVYVNNLLVPTGFKATAPVSFNGEIPEGGVIISSALPTIEGEWEGCQPLDDEDLELIKTMQGIPPELLNYLIEAPERTNAICASPEEIAEQEQQQQSTSNTAGGGSCAGLAIGAPTDGLAFGIQPFYWFPADGAASYRVLIYNEIGQLAGAFSTTGPETTVSGDMSIFGGSVFSWAVQALDASGNVMCGTDTVRLVRGAPPVAPPVAAPVATACTPICFDTKFSSCPPGYVSTGLIGPPNCPGSFDELCNCP